MRKIFYKGIAVFVASGLFLTACGQKLSTNEEGAAIPETESESETGTGKSKSLKKTFGKNSKTKDEAVEDTSKSEEQIDAEVEKPTVIDVGISSVANQYYSDSIFVGTSYATGIVAGDDAEEYPRLQTSFDAYANDMERGLADIQDELLEAAKEQAEHRSGEEYSYVSVNDDISAEIARSDTKAVSFLLTENEEWGGPHPNENYWGINFESKSGSRIDIRDVATDVEEFLDVVRQQVEKEYEDVADGFYDLDASFDLLKEDPSTINWLLGYEGITVLFNTDDLGPYAIGPQIVTVYYDEHPDLIRKEFTAAPDSYVIPVYEIGSQFYDFDGDGNRERFAVNAVEHSEGEYSQWYDWEVVKGNQKITISNYDFSKNAYLIRANDQYYLYLFGYSEGDSATLNVVDLKNWTYDEDRSAFMNFGATTGGFEEIPEQNISRYSNISYGMVDPGRLILSNLMQILGTYNGYKTYHVGKDGYPEPSDDFYTANMYRAMKAKRNIPCEYVDREGDFIGEGVLDKGSYVVVMRTDGHSWVDVVVVPESKIEDQGSDDFTYYDITEHPELEDYTDFIRIYTEETDEYYRTIDGVQEEEAFAGIMYAG